MHKNGVVTFVSNNSFIDSRTYDGFRKCVAKEFQEVYIIDLKGNARTSGERRRREGGNVFSDQIRVGVAVYFLVRKERVEGCKIHYNAVDDYWKAEEKKAYLAQQEIQHIPFKHLLPNEEGNWINIAKNDFDKLLPLANKETKQTKRKIEERALFKNYSLGIATNRDEWVYDFDDESLVRKIRYFCKIYGLEIDRWEKSNKRVPINDFVDRQIKWTSELEDHLLRGTELRFLKKYVRQAAYRPFVKQRLYFAEVIIHRMYQQNTFFPIGNSYTENKLICINTGNKVFNVLATDVVPNNHFNGDSQCFPLNSYGQDGAEVDNITDWGLEQFRKQYEKSRRRTKAQLTKEDIFHYVYGVLHNPAYRKKYELNLKRDFPRIPFYYDFWQWAEWGRILMKCHVEFEKAKSFSLKRIDVKSNVLSPQQLELAQKAKLRADKEAGIIILDGLTELHGVPAAAWEYKLGNRSALEWVLDQYKESKPSDPTIAERFNTYRFADYKEGVIELLKKVCTVSVKTMEIVTEMETAGR